MRYDGEVLAVIRSRARRAPVRPEVVGSGGRPACRYKHQQLRDAPCENLCVLYGETVEFNAKDAKVKTAEERRGHTPASCAQERGCVVLDQPQPLRQDWSSKDHATHLSKCAECIPTPFLVTRPIGRIFA